MKKIALVVAVVLFAFLRSEAKKIKGKIVFQDDTKEVTLNIPFKFFSGEPIFEKLQYKVKYFDASGRKITLRPDEASEIQFSYNGEDVRMISRRNTLGLGNIFSTSKNIFLKLEMDGHLKLFSYYYTESSPSTYSTTGDGMSGGYTYSVERYVLQKGGEELKRPRELSFRKDMVEYFSDCPLLVERIDDKDFRRRDMKAIVMFYNARCK